MDATAKLSIVLQDLPFDDAFALIENDWMAQELINFLNRTRDTIERLESSQFLLRERFVEAEAKRSRILEEGYNCIAIEQLMLSRLCSGYRQLTELFPKISRSSWCNLSKNEVGKKTHHEFLRVLQEERIPTLLPYADRKTEIASAAFVEIINKVGPRGLENATKLSRWKVALIELAIGEGWLRPDNAKLNRFEIYDRVMTRVHGFASQQRRLVSIAGLDFLKDIEHLNLQEVKQLVSQAGPLVAATHYAMAGKMPLEIDKTHTKLIRSSDNLQSTFSNPLAIPAGIKKTRANSAKLFIPLVMLFGAMIATIWWNASSSSLPSETTHSATDYQINNLEYSFNKTRVKMFGSSQSKIDLVPRFTSSPSLVKVMPFGSLYAVCDSFGMTCIYDPKNESVLVSLVGCSSRITSLAFFEEQRVVFGGTSAGTIFKWELPTKVEGQFKIEGKVICRLGSRREVLDLHVFPRERKIVCHDTLGSIFLMDEFGNLQVESKMFSAYGYKLEMNAEQTEIAFMGANSVKAQKEGHYPIYILDANLNLKSTIDFGKKTSVDAVFSSTDPNQIYCKGLDGSASFVWDIARSKKVRELDLEACEWLFGTEIGPVAVSKNSIEFLDTQRIVSIPSLPTEVTDFPDQRLNVSDDGNRLVIASKSERLHIDIDSKSTSRTAFPMRTLSIKNVCWIDDDHCFCHCVSGELIRVSIGQGRQETIAKNVDCMAWMDRSSQLVVFSHGAVTSYDAAGKKMANEIKIPNDRCSQMTLNNAETFLAVVGQDGLYICDVNQWQILNFIRSDSPWGIGFRSPANPTWDLGGSSCYFGLSGVDDMRLDKGGASISTNAIRVWHAEGNRVEESSVGSHVLKDSPIFSISDDGQRVLGASRYGNLGVWQLTKGEISSVRQLVHGTLEMKRARHLTFSQDSRFASAAIESGVLVWDLDAADGAPFKVLENERVARIFKRGALLYLVGEDNQVWSYAPSTKRLELIKGFHARWAKSLKIKDDKLAVGHRHGLAIFDFKTGRILKDILLINDGDTIVLDHKMRIQTGDIEKFERLFFVDENCRHDLLSPRSFLNMASN